MLVEQEQTLQRSVKNLNDRKQQLELLLSRHNCLKKPQSTMPNITSNTLNISKADVKTISTASLLDPNNAKRVTINLANAQDLFTNASSSSSAAAAATGTTGPAVSMITIHILPEVAQAILGSTSVDRNKLADLLQQANAANAFVTTNHNTLDSISTTTSMNGTS